MSNKNFNVCKKTDMMKWIIISIVVIALIASVIALFIKLDRQTTTTVIGGEAYSIGTLDEEGKYKEDITSIYLRNAVSVDGLKVEVKENAEVVYKLYFFDADNKFLSSTEASDTDFNGTIPNTAKTVKVVITPTADEDGKVSVTEVIDYANRIIVTVNK